MADLIFYDSTPKKNDTVGAPLDTFEPTLEFYDAKSREVSESEGGGEPIPVPRPILYELRGWYAVTKEYEYWQSTNPEEPPPSGNPLLDITQVSQTTIAV